MVELIDLELLEEVGETTSLILILTAFIVLTGLALRVKTVRSLQFQMFVFILILAFSEVPHIVGSLGLIDLTPIRILGLAIHTVSMAVLSAFILYRTYQFTKR